MDPGSVEPLTASPDTAHTPISWRKQAGRQHFFLKNPVMLRQDPVWLPCWRGAERWAMWESADHRVGAARSRPSPLISTDTCHAGCPGLAVGRVKRDWDLQEILWMIPLRLSTSNSATKPRCLFPKVSFQKVVWEGNPLFEPFAKSAKNCEREAEAQGSVLDPSLNLETTAPRSTFCDIL